MNAVDPALLNRASETILRLAHSIGIRIKAPFSIEEGGETIQFLAYLPEYGGPNGMIIGAIEFTPEIFDIFKTSEKKGWYCSIVSASAWARRGATEEDFKEALKEWREALKDWGYFGPQKITYSSRIKGTDARANNE